MYHPAIPKKFMLKTESMAAKGRRSPKSKISFSENPNEIAVSGLFKRLL
jgi:hypothetical protein